MKVTRSPEQLNFLRPACLENEQVFAAEKVHSETAQRTLDMPYPTTKKNEPFKHKRRL